MSTTRAVSVDGLIRVTLSWESGSPRWYLARKVEPGESRVDEWWYETVGIEEWRLVKVYPDTGQGAEAVLAQWEREAGRQCSEGSQ